MELEIDDKPGRLPALGAGYPSSNLGLPILILGLYIEASNVTFFDIVLASKHPDL